MADEREAEIGIVSAAVILSETDHVSRAPSGKDAIHHCRPHRYLQIDAHAERQ